MTMTTNQLKFILDAYGVAILLAGIHIVATSLGWW